MRQLPSGLCIQNRRAQSVRWRRGKFLEKVRERFLHARGVDKFYAGNFQSQNRKTHRHAMIVVGFNLRAVKRRRINCERITFFDDLRAALGQLGSQRDDAFTFLDTEASEVGEYNFVLGRWCKRNQSHNAVTQVGLPGDFS